MSLPKRQKPTVNFFFNVQLRMRMINGQFKCKYIRLNGEIESKAESCKEYFYLTCDTTPANYTGTYYYQLTCSRIYQICQVRKKFNVDLVAEIICVALFCNVTKIMRAFSIVNENCKFCTSNVQCQGRSSIFFLFSFCLFIKSSKKPTAKVLIQKEKKGAKFFLDRVSK